MFGKYVTILVKGLGSFKTFVSCTPDTPQSDLQRMARDKVSKAILNGCLAQGEEMEFVSEAK